MKILVTGAAGFIGFHLIKALLNQDCSIIGIDNLNPYYDVNLKNDRLKILSECSTEDTFKFIKLDLADRTAMANLFADYGFDIVVNHGAQAGVRNSIEKPH